MSEQGQAKQDRGERQNSRLLRGLGTKENVQRVQPGLASDRRRSVSHAQLNFGINAREVTASVLRNKVLFGVQLPTAPQALHPVAVDKHESVEWTLGQVTILADEAVTEELPLH